MTDERLLFGLLVMIAIGVSFVLTIVFFGFVVLVGALLVIAGLALLAVPRRRRTALAVLAAGGAALSGPLIYVGLAVLHSG
jgi:hypothetical protein